MHKKLSYTILLPSCFFVIVIILAFTWFGNQAVTVFHENLPFVRSKCFIIDAGHGGEDGGAISADGIPESFYNLEISKRLNDLLNLMGAKTVMIRTEDVSIYTVGNTLSEKKISDIKNRIRIINDIKGGVLVSIHQNYFPDEQYSGAQVFYADTVGSKLLAHKLQRQLKESLDKSNNRKCMNIKNVRLMDQINVPGVLIECGFLSNTREAHLLNNDIYQKKLCCAIATVLLNEPFLQISSY